MGSHGATGATGTKAIYLLSTILVVFVLYTTLGKTKYLVTETDLNVVNVTVKQGTLMGWSVDPGSAYAAERLEIFLGIPYAEPPLGERRFAPPETKKPWAPLTLNATAFSPICPQVLTFVHLRTQGYFAYTTVASVMVGENRAVRDYPRVAGKPSHVRLERNVCINTDIRTPPVNQFSFPSSFNNTDEDCLYMNIYTPKFDHMTESLPVMVWIHGGSYRYGAGQEYDGRPLALEGVVVVTFNFRLGVLGYLSTDDEVAPGNYGLLDQVLALEWIRDNIGSFRGDPKRVTIFGESSGGGSVSLHSFSKMSQGLFRAIIPQSGCAISPWAIYRPPHNVSDVTRQLASQQNCSVASSQSIIECLREVPAKELVRANVLGPPMIAAWAPRVDGHFIDKLPEVLLLNGDFERVPMFTGTVKDESADEAKFIPDVAQGFNRTFLEQLFYSWSTRFGSKTDLAFRAVKCEYFDANKGFAHNRDIFIQMKSDYGYVAPHQFLAEKYSAMGPPVWTYSFQYRSENDVTPKWLGVYHGTELYYTFGAPFAKEIPCPWGCININPDYADWTEQDRNISKTLMKIWTNFAKTRNPNPVPGMHANLLPFDTSTKAYLLISDVLSNKTNLKPRRMRFWNYKLPRILSGQMSIDSVCFSSAPKHVACDIFITLFFFYLLSACFR